MVSSGSSMPTLPTSPSSLSQPKRSRLLTWWDSLSSLSRFLAIALAAPLTGFLIAWLGGPRDWFSNNPGKCVMSVHGKIAVSAPTAGQWSEAMRLAIADFVLDEKLATGMADALHGMAEAMIRR